MQIFKEIYIGGLSKERLLKQLVDAGIQFNKYAHALFEDSAFNPDQKKEKVSLVKVGFSDLGISGACSLETIISKAANLGLKTCPLYLAAFLRLEYLEQPTGPYLTIVSTRPNSDQNYPAGLYLRNSENCLWLRGYQAEGECDWPAGHEFAFLV